MVLFHYEEKVSTMRAGKCRFLGKLPVSKSREKKYNLKMDLEFKESAFRSRKWHL